VGNGRTGDALGTRATPALAGATARVHTG